MNSSLKLLTAAIGAALILIGIAGYLEATNSPVEAPVQDYGYAGRNPGILSLPANQPYTAVMLATTPNPLISADSIQMYQP